MKDDFRSLCLLSVINLFWLLTPRLDRATWPFLKFDRATWALVTCDIDM